MRTRTRARQITFPSRCYRLRPSRKRQRRPGVAVADASGSDANPGFRGLPPQDTLPPSGRVVFGKCTNRVAGCHRGGNVFRHRPQHGPATVRPYSARPGNAALPPALRLRPGPAEPPALDPLARDPKLARLEAVLLFADEPLTARRLADVAGLDDAAEARTLLERLKDLYDA